MEQSYKDLGKILQAISDPKRLKIVDMLSCGEKCACLILEQFHIINPKLLLYAFIKSPCTEKSIAGWGGIKS